MTIPTVISNELEIIWDRFCVERNIYNNIREPQIIEGTSYQITQTVYERSRHARLICLQKHGYSCVVCGFNFKDKYGDIGDKFIHVHHLNQLSDNGIVYTNPENDLCPVCPNCHAMLHKRNPPYRIEELLAKMPNGLY